MHKGIPMLAGWLVILGGISIGLQGLFGYALFDSILGMGTVVEKIVQILIGASALYLAYEMVAKKGKQ